MSEVGEFEKPIEQESVEGYKETTIKLRFFRHDKKASGGSIPDTEIPLTPEGRAHAASIGDASENLGYEQAIAFGSNGKRAQETAGLVMTGTTIIGDTPEDESPFDYLKENLTAAPGTADYGSKLLIDHRLDFRLENDSDYGKAADAEYAKGNLLRFLVEKSDQMAAEVGDDKNSTYTSMAEAIASIIKKYIGIAPRFNALVNDPEKTAAGEGKLDPEMLRFFGTHQTIPECFLAKVIEITEGNSERDRFVAALGNQGFGYTEGFEFDIVTRPGSNEPVLHITYKKEGASPEQSFDLDEIITPEVIDQIAGEGVSQIKS